MPSKRTIARVAAQVVLAVVVGLLLVIVSGVSGKGQMPHAAKLGRMM